MQYLTVLQDNGYKIHDLDSAAYNYLLCAVKADLMQIIRSISVDPLASPGAVHFGIRASQPRLAPNRAP